MIGPLIEGNNLKTIYQFSVNGKNVVDFHRCCDHVEKTLLVLKSTTDRIFGGYTHLGWDSHSHHKLDPKAFLFSLTNKFGMPRVIKPKDKNKSTYFCHKKYGPIFGSECNIPKDDLIISLEGDGNPVSRCNLGHFYSEFEYGSEKAQTFLADVPQFEIKDIVVFQIINS